MYLLLIVFAFPKSKIFILKDYNYFCMYWFLLCIDYTTPRDISILTSFQDLDGTRFIYISSSLILFAFPKSNVFILRDYKYFV